MLTYTIAIFRTVVVSVNSVNFVAKFQLFLTARSAAAAMFFWCFTVNIVPIL